jgi:hypothetical protein
LIKKKIDKIKQGERGAGKNEQRIKRYGIGFISHAS